MSSLTLYYCYAREDRAPGEELKKHLSTLVGQGLITMWDDDEIQAGAQWQQENSDHLNTADIILLLVSPDLLTSKKLYTQVLSQAFARHERKEAVLIPVLLRPIDLEGTVISKLKALPSNSKPVTKWSNRDEAYADIAKGIRQVISTFRTKRGQGSSSGASVKEADTTRDEGSYRAVQSVFLFNAPLPDENEFFGRRRECTTLLDRTYKGGATSIVGPRRIGKTWLMQYMKQVASARFGSRFRFAYIDATLPRCATVAGFVASVLEELKVPAPQQAQEALNLVWLEQAMKLLKKQGWRPVLCIDEFEGMTNEETFDLRFFSGLRAIAQESLALVTASKRPLIELVSSTVKTSPFFNICEKLTLKPFSAKEAEAFVKAKSQIAGFDDQECERLLAYGQVEEQWWSPVRLQLVGTLLLEDKTLAQQEDRDFYRPADPAYWHDFERRLEEKYREVGL
ncbi:MAG: TIR domain-containing protein [Chloroflexota bacterium]|nr:TIR domain-containing protein [Chloroflexota bacterium]